MRQFAIIAALCLLSSCVSSSFRPIGGHSFSPRPEAWNIDVYVGDEAPVNVHESIPNPIDAAKLPAGAFNIGRIDTAGAPLASWGSMISDAKDKARELGGDAILIGNAGHYVQSIDSWGGAQHGKTLAMWVVRYASGRSSQ